MRIVIAYILVCMSICGCGRPSDSSRLSNLSDRKKLSEAINSFSIDLYKHLAGSETSEVGSNIIVSPLGVSVVLGMMYGGAGPAIASEMEQSLGWTDLKERVHPAFHDILGVLRDQPKVQLYLAGQVWFDARYELVPEYADRMKRYYQTSPEPLTFDRNNSEVNRRIGKWIENETHGQIRAGAIDLGNNEFANLLLTSVVYFKGDWLYKFSPHDTHDADFFLSNKTTMKVKMMHQKMKYKYLYTEKCDMLEKPYQGDTMSMVILLPAPDVVFDEFQKNLSWEKIRNMIDKLEMTKNVDVMIPRFRFTHTVRLVQPLMAGGLNHIFTDRSGFSKMTSQPNDFKIGGCSQQAYIDVNEKGTEAYAVTRSWSWSLSGERHSRFWANHPFIFLIRDLRTGSILFIGRVMSPPQSI